MASDHNKDKNTESHTGVVFRENNDWGGGEAGFGVGGETSLEKSRHTLMTSRKTRMASVSERSSTKRNAILTNECRNEALDLSFMYRSKGNTQISRETGEGW